jgi:23S rRNA pseudouridine2605 synthase
MDLLRGVRARVYPIGRLDYASEGILLLTNDGELAHALMKAASHVPKVYLVKVAGTPDETGLQRLRRGLMIPEARNFRSAAKSRLSSAKNSSDADGKNRPGTKSRSRESADDSESEPIPSAASDSSSRNARNMRAAGPRVKTAPAHVRLIRQADNPWYEVTLIEGKNRQLRKMFEEIGHHVEKIKRVKYGPLTLDVHPGEFRRLTVGEIAKLKSAAGALSRARPDRA